MSNNAFKINQSLLLKPTVIPILPQNGELYYDSAINKFQFRQNNNWVELNTNNYIINNVASVNTEGWLTYANVAGIAPVTGTGGSPTVTLTRSTVAPLRGNASFLYVKPALNVQGQGFSYDFTIDQADCGKVLQGSFEYQIASGTFADNDLSVWIYDVTNARMIQPAPYLLKNSGLIERFPLEFQTAINSTSYRLIIHQSSTSAVANTIKFDNFFVGPSAKLYGSAITDPIDYTPTISPNTNATPTAKWHREGKYLVVDGKVTWTGTGSQAYIVFSLPPGLSIDVTALPSGSVGGSTYLGSGAGAQQAVQSVQSIVAYNNVTSVAIYGGVSGTPASNKLAFDSNLFASAPTAGSYMNFYFKVPIQGWSSSQVMSSDASTRVVAAASDSKLATGTLNSSFNLMKIPAGNIDTHGTYNPTTGGYTIPVPGTYDISCYFESSFAAGSDTAAVSIGIAKNGVALNLYGSNFVSRSTIGNVTVSRSALVPLLAGDVITFLSLSAAVSPTFSSSLTGSGFSIKLIQGPSQIMASETVACSYYNVAGTAIGAGIVTVPFPTKYFDTHNALNPATGVFTAPISGVYLIRTAITSEVLNLSTSQGFYSNIRRGGTDISSNTSWGNGVTKRQETQSSIMVPLLAGETISVVTSSNVATTLSTGSQSHNNISIVRVGNY